MPLGYLATLLVLAGFAAVAWWPPPAPRSVALAGYLLGMVVNEVPHLTLGVPLVAATASAIVSGDLRRDAASAWLLVAAAGLALWIGLLVRRGASARSAVASGLRAAGVGVPASARGWVWRTGLSPLPGRPRDVVRIRDRRYGGHRRQRLDVYHRRDLPTGAPVLLYLHGGGYVSGSKHHEGRALLHAWAARGWVCVSADYRLRPHAGFADHLADARAALAWTRDHVARVGGDPDTVVMAGSSAGAHLTSLCALDPGTGLAAAIGLYGYYGRYDGRTDDEAIPSTPLALSAAGAPPFFLAHGDRDTMTPLAGTRALAAKLREESSAPVVRVELPGGQHGFDLLRSWRCAAVLAGVEAFLADPGVGLARNPPRRRR